MELSYLTDKAINKFIKEAFIEDVGDGDHSSLAAIPAKTSNQAQLLIKEDGIIAGLEMAQKIFHYFDPSLQLNFIKKDGEAMKSGEVAFTVEGSARSILTCERLVLNCMQRMSGIATHVRHLTNLIEGTRARILDTRKTTPNFRLMEKWAVVIGGGTNHRYGLFDMIMLKDNHIDFAGGIDKAIQATQHYLKKHKKKLKVEIETRNLQEVEQVLKAGGIDIIMLDNMSPADMKTAVQLINGRYETEASGGITEQNLREVAECGVDYISLGIITYGAKSLDMSLKAV